MCVSSAFQSYKGALDIDDWLAATSVMPYPKYSAFYEPYVIMNVANRPPRFREEILSVGFNKLSWALEAALTGHRFFVLPSTYLLDKPSEMYAMKKDNAKKSTEPDMRLKNLLLMCDMWARYDMDSRCRACPHLPDIIWKAVSPDGGDVCEMCTFIKMMMQREIYHPGEKVFVDQCSELPVETDEAAPVRRTAEFCADVVALAGKAWNGRSYTTPCGTVPSPLRFKASQPLLDLVAAVDSRR